MDKVTEIEQAGRKEGESGPGGVKKRSPSGRGCKGLAHPSGRKPFFFHSLSKVEAVRKEGRTPHSCSSLNRDGPRTKRFVQPVDPPSINLARYPIASYQSYAPSQYQSYAIGNRNNR